MESSHWFSSVSDMLKRGEELREKEEKKISREEIGKLLKEIAASQVPTWITYASFIIVALSLGISIWSLLHSYGLI